MTSDAASRHLVVVGGGIGGYTAAIRAARQGLAVTLVESGALGGTCLNVGCIPTKSLLHQARTFQEAADWTQFGVDATQLTVGMASVMARKDTAVQQLVRGVQTLVRRNRITLVAGTAAFTGPKTLQVVETGAVLQADAVVIASGSEPVLPPIAGIDLEGVVTSDGALALQTMPRRMLIIGGGVIGVEFAQIFSSFGAVVTVVELLERILTEEDQEAATVLQRSLARQGIEFLLGSKVQEIRRADGALGVHVQTPQGARDCSADVVLVAVGRKPRLQGLALERAGVQVQAGAIRTDARCRTSVSGVYAVGDVRGGLLLAHKAAAEAECAIADLLGQHVTMDGRAMPRAVYTDPELAAVGLTEAQARGQHAAIKVGRFPFAASGKAITNGHIEGFVKVIADAATDQILGFAMVGADVTNLLGEATLAVQMELTLPALMDTVHAHPTLTEALMEAAHDAFNAGAIHLPPRQL